MSTALALAEGTDAEYDLCIISGIFDSIWTIAFFPLLHGVPDWSDWMLFVVAVLGVVMDFAYAVTTRKHIDSNTFGAIFTCIYGIVHLVFTVFNIVRKGADGAETAMALVPCADEILKILRLSKEMEITMLTVLMDIATAGILVFGGLKYIRKN